MTTNPNEDKDFDAIKAKIPFDNEDDKKTEQPAPTPPKPEEKSAPEKKTEEKPPVSEEEEEPAPPPPNRPLKYIPVGQYTEEKKKWTGDMAAKDRRIKDLEKVSAGAQNTAKFDENIKKYAEKHGLEESVAREEITRFKDAFGTFNPNGSQREEPEVEKKEEDAPDAHLSEEQKTALQEAELIKAEKAYDTEYSTVAVPQLKSFFPQATEAQILAAKEEVEKLACTEKYLKSPLDYIVFKEKDALSAIFAPDRKGPEPTRPSPRGKQSYTSQDFEGGKTPFTALASLTPEERNKIVLGFSSKTWDKYTHFNNTQAELEIS